MNSNVIMILAIFTLGAGLLWGIMSWLRAKQAKDHHEDAVAAHHHRDASALDRSDVEETTAGRTWTEERGANPPTPEDATPMPPRN